MLMEYFGISRRITPAHAGKRIWRATFLSFFQDHPRPCGEKRFALYAIHLRHGSPPPMRGKGWRSWTCSRNLRITPAHAGKSSASETAKNAARDHPRPCGEKRRIAAPMRVPTGSPPPMRGKEVADELGAVAAGITPAHAGKRYSACHPTAFVGDHPRPCGEKATQVDPDPMQKGSPPPMRGKVRQPIVVHVRIGITPAHAGKSSCAA